MRKTYLMSLFATLVGVPLAHATPAGWAPQDFKAMYHQSEDGSSATTIVLVTVGAMPDLASNLATYRSQFSLPTCSVNNGCLKFRGQDGSTTLPASTVAGWPLNGDTQAQIASAGCKLCKITIVEASSAADSDLAIAIKTAKGLGTFVHAGVQIAETSTEVSGIETAYSGAGVALVAPSGDGSGAIRYPAVSPQGFGISRASVSLSGGVYTHTLNGGRGGFSAVFSRQSAWEPNIGSNMHSAVTLAVVGTNVALYTNGAWTTADGTLVASSLFTGLIAAMEGAIIVPSDLVNLNQFLKFSGTDDNSNAAGNNTFNKGDGFGAQDFSNL